MSKIKIGIIGAGYISEKHLEVLCSIKKISIISIYSRTESKSIKLAKKFKIDKVHSNIDNFISNSKLDGILILVSADQIFKIVKKLLPYKIPLFIEKPAGLNPKETKQLIEINNNFKTKTMIGLNRRFYSIFKEGLKAIYKEGPLLGVGIEGHERFWKSSTGLSNNEKKNWIFSNSIHTIDLLRFFGGEIKRMNSFKKNIFEKNGDQFTAIFEFKSGTIGTYVSHWYSPGGWSVVLYGSGVTVIFKPLEEGIIINKQFKSKKINPIKQDKIYKSGFYNQLLCFIDLIINKKLKFPGQSLENYYKTSLIAKSLIK